MELSVHIDDAFEAQVDPEPLKKALLTTLQWFDETIAAGPDRSLTLTVTSAEMVQQLNFQYLGHDAPTDVLSFENTPDADFPDVDEALARHLGDIVIAYPVAEAQARAAGHATQAELMLLAVHGALHLLGFDHDTAEHKAKMWAAQQQVMAVLGLAHIQPTEA
jgi:probable rRNA maturation factor